MQIVKIGTVELTEQEAEKILQSGKYIVTYSRIFQVFHSPNAGYYGREVYYQPKMARRGRFHVMAGSEINRMLGIQLLN